MKLKSMQNIFIKELIRTLDTYSECAYTPYSNFKVACALITDANEVIRGVNIENASYGLSMCAERNAIASAVALKTDLQQVKTIVVYHRDKIVAPCGACAQVISELLDENVNVIMASKDDYEVCKVKELLPFKFSEEDLR